MQRALLDIRLIGHTGTTTQPSSERGVAHPGVGAGRAEAEGLRGRVRRLQQEHAQLREVRVDVTYISSMPVTWPCARAWMQDHDSALMRQGQLAQQLLAARLRLAQLQHEGIDGGGGGDGGAR